MLAQGRKKKQSSDWILCLHHGLDPTLQLVATWQKCYLTMKVKFRCTTIGSLFQKKTLWTRADLEIAQVGPRDNCFCRNHHPRLKSSCTDTDLPLLWGKSVNYRNVSSYLDVCADRKKTDNQSANQSNISVSGKLPELDLSFQVPMQFL